MNGAKKLLMAAAGGAGGDPVYVEDVFSSISIVRDDHVTRR